MSNKKDDTVGRFAYGGLERLLHEKTRLGILTSLLVHPHGLLFNDLKELCSLTDGNLSRHLSSLSKENIVEVWKAKHGRPQTLCRLTEEGRKRFLDYLNQLESVISVALQNQQSSPAPQNLSEGFSPA